MICKIIFSYSITKKIIFTTDSGVNCFISLMYRVLSSSVEGTYIGFPPSISDIL
jgi:hypothetical protein